MLVIFFIYIVDEIPSILWQFECLRNTFFETLDRTGIRVRRNGEQRGGPSAAHLPRPPPPRCREPALMVASARPFPLFPLFVYFSGRLPPPVHRGGCPLPRRLPRVRGAGLARAATDGATWWGFFFLCPPAGMFSGWRDRAEITT